MRLNNLTSKPRVRLPHIPVLTEPDVIHLKNGIPVFLFPSGNTGIVRLELTFRAGTLTETQPLQARFTNIMLPGGTSAMTAREIDEAFDFLGSFPNYSVDRDRASVQLYVLPESFNEAITLLRMVISDPVFPPEELEMHRETRLQTYLINRQRVSFISLDYFFELLFGSDHPYGRRVIPEHFGTIGRESLIGFHRLCYLKGIERITLSGNFDESSIKIVVSQFEEFPPVAAQTRPPQPFPAAEQKNKLFIEKQGALQSSVRIGRRIVGMGHTDFTGLKVTDTILGGYFGSRLMANLREDKGYTYGIGSSLFNLNLTGVQMIATEVGAGVTENALREIYREMSNLGAVRVQPSELRLVRNSMLGDLARQFDGPFASTDSYLGALEAGLSMSYFRLLEETIKSITANEIKRLAETYYNENDFTEVVAGSMR
ncbi:MAG: insulinase family protein [Bacteroidetes bacterium]|nr:insulinase family protein [Bacteroidota bacterium]